MFVMISINDGNLSLRDTIQTLTLVHFYIIHHYYKVMRNQNKVTPFFHIQEITINYTKTG